ncbi:hypothetical protein [Streptomyces sp. NPDC001292]|uniref:hypothetical protein n=1 Tax=Streptomyces sp. NPDC001292 TaxID=3364558 RepID=UPI00369578BB
MAPVKVSHWAGEPVVYPVDPLLRAAVGPAFPVDAALGAFLDKIQVIAEFHGSFVSRGLVIAHSARCRGLVV